MANFVFNIAKGRVNELCRLPGTDDAVIAVVLQAGQQADGTLQDYDTLADLLAANAEQTDMGRKTLAPTVSVDDAGNRQSADATDLVWDDSIAIGADFAKLILCYVPDTTTSTDADVIPLCGYDWSGSPLGTEITAEFNANGFFRAS